MQNTKGYKVDATCMHIFPGEVIEKLSWDVERKGKLLMSCQKHCMTHPAGQMSNRSDNNCACIIALVCPTCVPAYKPPKVSQAAVDWQPTHQSQDASVFFLSRFSWLRLPVGRCSLSRWRRERNRERLEASQSCWWRTFKRSRDCGG